MSEAPIKDHDKQVEFATSMQTAAANPRDSVFVSANAGSGKTKVLVGRVSRLLLEGARPEKILCLTFTKAAAAEMQSRLFETLGEWSILSDEKLGDALDRLHNRKIGQLKRNQEDLKKARLLFARALETPGGLKVQTIHAFCEKLLKRFPLEAGILPASEALDEADSKNILAEIIEEIQTKAYHGETQEAKTLANAISTLAQIKADQDFDDLYRWATNNFYKVRDWQKSGGTQGLAQALNLEIGTRVDDVKAQAWNEAPHADIKLAAQEMLEGGGATDAKKAHIIFEALELSRAEKPIAAFDIYVRAFLTQKDEPVKNMVTAKGGSFAVQLFGNKKEPDAPETIRILAVMDQISRAVMLEQTDALYTVSTAIADLFERKKRNTRSIDFNDQINLARRLLQDSAAQEWVRYKLDGGVSHILVDEAQDTSDQQWDIVDALAEPFFQPSPDSDPTKPRTIFAVGDEKQSIYSFQGAKPELFLHKIQTLNEKFYNPDKPTTSTPPKIRMEMSFRSSPDILALVDQVFYRDQVILESFDTDALPEGADLGAHHAFRTDNGLIEFWPATKQIKSETDEKSYLPIPSSPEQNDPDAPVDQADPRTSREQLADKIAQQIRTWIDDGEPIFDRDHNNDDPDPASHIRPMRAGDILILVKTRNDFYRALIRNLKQKNIPIAGADRMVLAEELCIQDLISLAKFVLLPSDDLSLAEVLKSPLIGWDDEALYALSSGRKTYGAKTYWGALRCMADQLPDGGMKGKTDQALSILLHLKQLARQYAPYEFFARGLSYIPDASNPDSLLQRFYNRLGTEITDSIEAFLAQCLNHQRRGAPSLRQFIANLESDEGDIKREMDGMFNEVRVLTVHGAKGLEAPVVILPDTTTHKASGKDSILPIKNEDGQSQQGFVLKPMGVKSPAFFERLKADAKAKTEQEDLRLLYVALTRAESRLLICGYESRNKVAENSWHDRLEKSLNGMEAKTVEMIGGEGLVYGAPLSAPISPSNSAPVGTMSASSDLPHWAKTPFNPVAQPIGKTVQYYSPSQLELEKKSNPIAVRSPLDLIKDGQIPSHDRYARGNHIHKLLQILPDLSVAIRREWAHKYLIQNVKSDLIDADEIIETVFSVLENEQFAPFFTSANQSDGDNFSAAEISLAGQIDGLPKHIGFNGQIDRLCMVEGQVWVLDYKSNRPPPKSAADLPLIYVRQMAAYRDMVREIYPNRAVHTAILWTDGPRLMTIGDDILDGVNWKQVFAG